MARSNTKRSLSNLLGDLTRPDAQHGNTVAICTAAICLFLSLRNVIWLVGQPTASPMYHLEEWREAIDRTNAKNDDDCDDDVFGPPQKRLITSKKRLIVAKLC